MFDRLFPGELLSDQAGVAAWRPVVELLGSQERVWVAFAFDHGMLELERTGRLEPRPRMEAIWQVGIEPFQALAGRRDQIEPAVEQGSARELRAYRALVSALEETIRSFRAEASDEGSGSC